jgi:hypothetical protein
MLHDEDILVIAGSTVIREENDRILLFNSLSDEMYLIHKEALHVLELCQGVLTVRQISNLVRLAGEDRVENRELVKKFLRDLVYRKLLEVHVPEMVIHESSK